MSMRIRGRVARRRRSRSAASPRCRPCTGMRTSISTTSGRCRPAELDRLGAVGRACRRRAKSCCVVEQCREAGADDLLVVGDDDPDRHGAGPRSGARPRRRSRRRRPGPACQRCRRPWSPARACRAGRARRASPSGGPARGRGPAGRSAVGCSRARRRPPRPARGGGRWSAPPARSGTPPGRRPAAAGPPSPSSVSGTGVPAARALSIELVEVVEPRLRVRASASRLRVLAEDAEQAAHLGRARRAPSAPIASKCARPSSGRPGVVRRARLGLDGDHRDVVGDNVVQLARDPSALLHRGLVLQRVDHRLPGLRPARRSPRRAAARESPSDRPPRRRA